MRYGHLNFLALHFLSKMQYVKRLPTLPNSKTIFHDWQADNIARVFQNFLKQEHLRSILNFADLVGPIQTASLNGSKYFFVFTDYKTKKRWIYFIKEKSEALSKFKIFKATTETATGKRIYILRSDREGEFLTKYFDEKASYTGSYTRLE